MPRRPRDRQTPAPSQTADLQGLITDADLHLADAEFPGIVGFYRTCLQDHATLPRTFLDLLVRFQAFTVRAA